MDIFCRLPGEVFKPVKHDSRYAVSNYGRVYAFGRERVREGIVKQFKDTTGYYAVNIGNRRRHVHRLVLEAFAKNQRHLLVANHIDGIKTNNRLENLEWTSYRGNLIHAYKTGLHRGRRRIVCRHSMDGIFEKQYESIISVTQDGFNAAHVVQCAKGRRKSHGGRIWYYG
jgi:hypothetical protein